MTVYQQLLSDYQLHKKSRFQKHKLYPDRYWVPDDKISWEIEFSDYAPTEFNAPVVLNPQTPWADPHDISKVPHPFSSFMGKIKLNKAGIPLNPIGRTGICGRGVLGKWGANFAADGIITTINPKTKQMLVLTITRKDTGEMAFPGGMVDASEDVLHTRNRELEEELSVKESDLKQSLYEKRVTESYVDDPRNTDNAWLETTVFHTHITFDAANKMKLKAGDDAASYSWTIINSDTIMQFYANHGLNLILALKQFYTDDKFTSNQEIDKILSN